jgi:hypothetical protein
MKQQQRIKDISRLNSHWNCISQELDKLQKFIDFKTGSVIGKVTHWQGIGNETLEIILPDTITLTAINAMKADLMEKQKQIEAELEELLG